MVKLEFYDPSGRLETRSRTRRDSHRSRASASASSATSSGRRIRMLPLLKTLLEQDFPGIEVLPIDAFPQGNALIGNEETAALVKESGVDAVIIGNAA